MIYIHTYYTGKFNSVEHTKVYESLNSAKEQAAVLGGLIKVCEVKKIMVSKNGVKE